MRPRREPRESPRRWAIAILAAAILLSAAAPFLSRLSIAFAQANPGEDEEVVANLAAGRAAILVGRDGIVVGTLESRAEADTRPPLIVPLGSYRLIVLLGAAEWVTPVANRPPLRMDVELRRAVGPVAGFSRQQETATFDIEGIGLAFLEPLRAAAARLHRKLVWPADEALVELLLVQYVEGYGPEVWSIRYTLEQEFLRGDFYRTHVPRPHYLQLYPPEKGQPHTFVEAWYPQSGAPLPLLADLLKRNDPRLARLRSADEQLAAAADRLVHGESRKLSANQCLEFLRAALNSVAEENARQMIAVIHEDKGLQWIAGEEEAAVSPASDKPREPGVPVLRKKP